jgi:hypothetical protein
MAKDGENSDAKGGQFLCGFLLMNHDLPVEGLKFDRRPPTAERDSSLARRSAVGRPPSKL